jgi:hypothetical protein
MGKTKAGVEAGFFIVSGTQQDADIHIFSVA